MTELFKKTLICGALAVSILMTACSSGPTNLETMIGQNESAKTAIEAQCKDGQTVEVKENCLVYTYKFDSTYKSGDLKKVKADITKELESSRLEFQKAAAALQESSGIEKINVKIIYLNGDGKEIYSEEI